MAGGARLHDGLGRLLARVRVTIVAFARLRELIGAGSRTMELETGSSVRDLWRMLADSYPELEPMTDSTRVARNGRLVSFDAPLAQGDEVALLPPVGGG